jgi:hypothetical protein
LIRELNGLGLSVEVKKEEMPPKKEETPRVEIEKEKLPETGAEVKEEIR